MNLTVTLANTDFKLTYFGSALGYLWTLMRPLLFFGVLLVVFSKIFHVGQHIPHYPVSLLGAIILWTFFVQVTTASVQCLLSREGLLRKMRFPRLVIPLAVALTALYQLCLNMVPVFIFAVASGVYPRWSWLERWHLDLNAVMRRPSAARVRAAVRKGRRFARVARKVKRRLSG